MTARQELLHAMTEAGTRLCIGMDPHPEYVDNSIVGLLRWGEEFINQGYEFCAAFKFNVAFFEAYGGQGLDVLAELIDMVPPSRYVILDAKRADIGTTAAEYARAAFDRLGVDAVTVNPYMGLDAVEPFVRHRHRLVFVLALTSNPGAQDFQLRDCEGMPLYERVVRTFMQAKWSRKLGYVVGATYPKQLAMIRAIVGPEVPLLIPGIGAQGGKITPVLKANADGVALFNVSRSLLKAYSDEGVRGYTRVLRQFYRKFAVR